MIRKNVREVFTGVNALKPIAPGQDLMALIMMEARNPMPKPEKIVFDDRVIEELFNPEKLVPANLRFPHDFGRYEEMIRGKEVPEDGANRNKAQMLLSRHPLIEKYDAVFTRDNAPQLPEGVFMDGNKLVVLHPGVTAVDGEKKAVMLFAVDNPAHYEAVYGFVEITAGEEDAIFVASKTATICEIVNSY